MILLSYNYTLYITKCLRPSTWYQKESVSWEKVLQSFIRLNPYKTSYMLCFQSHYWIFAWSIRQTCSLNTCNSNGPNCAYVSFCSTIADVIFTKSSGFPRRYFSNFVNLVHHFTGLCFSNNQGFFDIMHQKYENIIKFSLKTTLFKTLIFSNFISSWPNTFV